jgi:hypothetical protein
MSEQSEDPRRRERELEEEEREARKHDPAERRPIERADPNQAEEAGDKPAPPGSVEST